MGSKYSRRLRSWYAIIYWINITHDLSYSSRSPSSPSSITIILIILTFIVPSLASPISDLNSLNSIIYNYSSSTLMRSNHKTGVLYNVTDLPSSLDNIKVSIIRLRTGSLWAKGLKSDILESFDIPPRISTRPYVKRVDIIFSNLGKKLSSQYYVLPGYTIITSVTSFLTYASTNYVNNNKNYTTGHPPPLLNLSVRGEPIKIKFHNNLLVDHPTPSGKKKCVRFDPSGLVELSDTISDGYVCSSRGQGHFAIAIPSSPPPLPALVKKKRGIRLWKWWLIGFLGGLIGLLFVGLVGFFMYKAYKIREFKRMEKKSERSEVLDNTWVNGTSRMPSAAFTRTEAATSMEYDYFH